jgi:RNA polymerase sigma-70 factor, ECF subfamily
VSRPEQSGAFGTGPLGTLAPIPDPSPPTGPDDADRNAALVRRARGGDREALEQLLRDNYDQIHAVCRRITGNTADAADAAQNALIAVTRGLSRFDDRSRFSSWAYRIAVNCSIDELRRRSRGAVVSLDDPDQSGWRDRAAPLVAAPSDDPELAAIRLDVDGALRRLRLEFRAPLVLRDLCGLDYAEIAEILQLPAGTVRSRIARARSALVRLLEPSRSEQ